MADNKKPSKWDVIFTVVESKLLLSIMKNLTSDIKFDADAVAAECGLKDGNIAKIRWKQIKKQKVADAAGAPAAGVKKRAPKKSTPNKLAADDLNGDADDEEGLTTPAMATATKKPKKRARKPKAKKVEEVKEDNTVKIEAELDDAMD